jgi:D-inositol-3-phosphate glycosyltransferase
VRILLVSAYGVPHMGGIEVAVDALATELAGRGHVVTHVTSSAGSEEDDRDHSYRQIRVRALNPLEDRIGVPYPLFGPTLLTTLNREVARADIVHTHGYIYQGSVTAAALCGPTIPRTPLVLTEHVGHVPYNSGLLDRIQTLAIRALGLRVLKRADAVITYNDRVADQLASLWPSIPQTTILNGVDTELFRPPEDEERSQLRAGLGWGDSPQVLFVGRPVAKKGFPDAVSAVSEARLPNVGLVVVGSDNLPVGTPERVISLGRLCRRRLAEVYRACDAMIVPARGEGFPLAAQEAMSSGLPLLLADDPGYAPNLVGAGSAIRLVSDPAEYPRVLAKLLADPESLEKARRAAAAHARDAFSWARTTAQHEALYEQLLAGL